MGVELTVWRHPAPLVFAGLCIGHTDIAVDRRKSKHLAHRIRVHARRHGLPRIVVTSPLRRGADTGRQLARWGWKHVIDPRLLEVDFGDWDGRAWSEVPKAAIDAWCADFHRASPGGGEPVASLMARCAAFIESQQTSVCVVGHAGWLSAALWLQGHGNEPPTATAWPRAVPYCTRTTISREARPAASASSPDDSAYSTPKAHPAPYRPMR